MDLSPFPAATPFSGRHVVYDARGNIIGTYIGTNDAGATETDPTGGGSNPANNMVIVTSAQYDGGTAVRRVAMGI